MTKCHWWLLMATNEFKNLKSMMNTISKMHNHLNSRFMVEFFELEEGTRIVWQQYVTNLNIRKGCFAPVTGKH